MKTGTAVQTVKPLGSAEYYQLHHTAMKVTAFKLCHTKICLKIFFCYHTKRRLGAQGPANRSLGMTPTIELYTVNSSQVLNCKVVDISKEGLAGPCPPTISFGMTMKKIFRRV